MGKLNPQAVAKLLRPSAKPGMNGDGGGLYLQVGRGSARSWIFRFALHNKEHYLGLGSAHAISLKRARELAAKVRQQRAEGLNPLSHRREQRAASRLAALRGMTFKQCAERLLDAREGTWRNAKHRQQWHNTLAAYAYPTIGALPVQDVDTALVVACLEPIWNSKRETASRLRGRIENVLDWATVAGYRQGDNPARWRGHLVHLLAARSKLTIKHYPALDYRQVSAFMVELRSRQGIGARCLEFVILTAARTGEAIGARWSEIDLSTAIWAIPAERMKSGIEHRVPLSPHAVAILRELSERRESEFVFPGARTGQPLSKTAMLKILELMDRGDLTVHGFRSTFRDWAAEQTSFPHEVCEQALAHAVSSKTAAAYLRGTMFEKRRALMTDWARFCAKPAGDAKVLPLRGVS